MNTMSSLRKRLAVLGVVLCALLLCGAAGTAASSGGEHGEAAPKGWVASDTYRVMNFAVLAIGLYFILRKPLSKALGARIKGIKEELDELEAKKRQAEKELASYNQKLSLLDQEAEKIVADYTKQGEEAKARILKEAEAAAEKLELQAQHNIEHEFEQAKAKLCEEILEKALISAEATIKEKITIEDQEKLVDDYLEKVVA
jgi:F-type H+-transporting ATPase subunit b